VLTGTGMADTVVGSRTVGETRRLRRGAVERGFGTSAATGSAMASGRSAAAAAGEGMGHEQMPAMAEAEGAGTGTGTSTTSRKRAPSAFAHSRPSWLARAGRLPTRTFSSRMQQEADRARRWECISGRESLGRAVLDAWAGLWADSPAASSSAPKEAEESRYGLGRLSTRRKGDRDRLRTRPRTRTHEAGAASLPICIRFREPQSEDTGSGGDTSSSSSSSSGSR
jgi:hypothetical protein